MARAHNLRENSRMCVSVNLVIQIVLVPMAMIRKVGIEWLISYLCLRPAPGEVWFVRTALVFASWDFSSNRHRCFSIVLRVSTPKIGPPIVRLLLIQNNRGGPEPGGGGGKNEVGGIRRAI